MTTISRLRILTLLLYYLLRVAYGIVCQSFKAILGLCIWYRGAVLVMRLAPSSLSRGEIALVISTIPLTGVDGIGIGK